MKAFLRMQKTVARPITCALLVVIGAEAGAGFWEWDCSRDPTILDANGDGVLDWAVRFEENPGSFIAENLVDGKWLGGQTLDNRPINDYAVPFTVDLIWKATESGAWQATFWMNVDYHVERVGDSEVEFCSAVYMHLETDGVSQTLTMYNIYEPWVPREIGRFTGLPNDFVNLRLEVDTKGDTVGVRIDGEDKGTYEYTAWGPANADRWATILGNGMEADYIKIQLKDWPIPGDVNLDCRVNILDLICVRNLLLKDPAKGDNWKADVNSDGKIDILDLIAVRNHLNTRCPPG